MFNYDKPRAPKSMHQIVEAAFELSDDLGWRAQEAANKKAQDIIAQQQSGLITLDEMLRQVSADYYGVPEQGIVITLMPDLNEEA